MSIGLLLGRILIAVVFFTSGLTKLIDLEETSKGFRDFGVPDALLPSFSIVLPVAEIIIAIVLIPLATAWWGALASLVLFTIFTIAIATNLWMGKKPSCNCFGQLQKKPISWKTVIRNLFLLLVAACMVWYGRKNPGFSILAWRDSLTFLEQIAVFVLALNSVLVMGASWLLFLLWHQQGRLLARIELLEAAHSVSSSNPVFHEPIRETGRAIGSAISDFTLIDLSGHIVLKEALLTPGKSLLLLFIDLKCGSCNAFLPTVSYWQQTLADTIEILIISRGETQENFVKKSEHNLTYFFLQKDQEVSKVFGVEVTPSAVLIDQEGRVSSTVRAGAEAITELITQFTQTSERVPNTILNTSNLNVQRSYTEMPSREKIGQFSVQFNLSDVNGQSVTLNDFRGRNTLIIFWDPSCSFCSQMLPQLRAWEVFSPANAPQILIVSVGTADSNRSMGLKARIVLDKEFTLTRQFEVRGTPSGILFDAEGQVASNVVVGASAIFNLLLK